MIYYQSMKITGTQNLDTPTGSWCSRMKIRVGVLEEEKGGNHNDFKREKNSYYQ